MKRLILIEDHGIDISEEITLKTSNIVKCEKLFEKVKEVCELLIEDAIALKNINEIEEWRLSKRETVSLMYEKEIEKAKQVLSQINTLENERGE